MNKQYKTTPCDDREIGCPYDAQYSEDCRFHCGLGVDEDSYPEEEYEEYEEDPMDGFSTEDLLDADNLGLMGDEDEYED